ARGRASDVGAAAHRLGSSSDVRLVEDATAQHGLWAVRETGYGATGQVPGRRDGRPGWEDAGVAPERLGDDQREMRRLWESHGYDVPLYGHFGQGCVHTRFDFDLSSEAGVAEYRAFLEEAAEITLAHGGSLSGEHGDGQQRAFLLKRMFGPELMGAFARFKALWDPDGRMNPGKVVDAERTFGPGENLRLGPGRRIWEPRTRFALTDDGGSFDHLVGRCVGVGKCRREDGGVMCPSYMVTRDEEHSTRGRARLLFEMADGGVITDGWRSKEVASALDLCLACKGCKVDCPVGVDMATYKAEFYSHHYAGRLRPAAAYSMGLIMLWARGAALAPRAVNALARSPLTSPLLRRAGGITPNRPIPAFAEQTFASWVASRPRPQPGTRGPVMLVPDTFTNYLEPGVGKATTDVLERAGFAVQTPRRGVCCGRPLYDFGMLDLARQLWRWTLRQLAPAVMAGMPIVVPEPSCAAAFRDELPALMPDSSLAARLARQTVTLAELLTDRAPDAALAGRGGQVLVQPHCHQHAVMGMDAELAVLARAGFSASLPDAGCCGLAGSFGFQREKYDVSMACGERALFPAVRDLPPGVAVVADGFSCRTQILQGTGRRAVHLAELLAGG
ncbi:MAG: FAD-binding and (Fe-S)-binding domain-containing protein, partial [Acidimicrobiales bacterium]